MRRLDHLMIFVLIAGTYVHGLARYSRFGACWPAP
jgi:predicted membrane channel-forming protein YqfA (hemolysin III family)